MVNSFYDIVEKDASGNDFPFSNFKGKVVYGVNVASKCGYTASGYNLLSRIAKLKDKGVEVAIFPCNQFGGQVNSLFHRFSLTNADEILMQEPGSDKEIENFCALKGVQGANVFTKADVNGPKTRPTYKYVKEKTKMGDIAWNFAGKFLVDKEGNGKQKLLFLQKILKYLFYFICF